VFQNAINNSVRVENVDNDYFLGGVQGLILLFLKLTALFIEFNYPLQHS